MSVEELVDEIWPHWDDGEPSYRDGQKEIILDCLERLFVDGKDYYFVSAPTGFGKSPVGYTLAFAIGLVHHESGPLSERAKSAQDRLRSNEEIEEVGYYTTPQNILLDQLEADYGGLSGFGMFKGRAHYPCSEEPNTTCAEGPCRFNQAIQCTSYACDREMAMSSPVTNTNFSMFMKHPDIASRPGLVVDEAHMMPEYVLGEVEVKLRADRLANEGWEIPKFDSFEEYVEWLEPKARDLELAKQELNTRLEQQSMGPGGPEKSLVRRYERVSRMQSKMNRLVLDWSTEGEDWVVDHGSLWDDRKSREIDTVSFRPITPYRFMGDLVFESGYKCVISSATPPKPKLIGLDPSNVHIEEVESPFPVNHREVIVDPVAKMSKSNRQDNLDEMVCAIKDRAVMKTLVHAHTYDFAESIADRLGAIEGSTDVHLQDPNRREESLEEWVNSDAQYFISVNMYDGIDLEDDKCRTNIICVVPWPYMGDPQLQKRQEKEGDEFINWRTAMRIMQAAGRSTRSEEDWSNTYILDSRFKWFWSSNKKEYFFDWFNEAVRYA